MERKSTRVNLILARTMLRVRGWPTTSIGVNVHPSIREKTALFSKLVTAVHARMELLVKNSTTLVIIPAHVHSGFTDKIARTSPTTVHLTPVEITRLA